MDANAPLHNIMWFFSGSERVVQDYHERIRHFPTPPNSVYSCSSTLHNVAFSCFFSLDFLANSPGEQGGACILMVHRCGIMDDTSQLSRSPFLKDTLSILGSFQTKEKMCDRSQIYVYFTLPKFDIAPEKLPPQ